MEFDLRSQGLTFKHEISINPKYGNDSFADHYHTVYELLYIISGDADLVVEHTEFHIKPYSLLVIRPGTTHHIVLKSSTTYDRVVIRFDEKNISEGLRKNLDQLNNVYYIKNAPIADLFEQLDHSMDYLDKQHQLNACLAHLELILSYLYASEKYTQAADNVNEPLELLLKHIDKNLTNIHTINDLCDELHMSRSSIHKIFNKYSGMSIMNYIRTRKIFLAHKLLNSGMNATKVYTKCGFNDYSTFYRAYKNIFNEAPTTTYHTPR